MINGIINVYKEKGYTSFDVVARMRGIFHQKKIGHTGTLDPDAEGVLPVCLGSATKVCDLLTDKDKVYEAVMLLGRVTDTQDISGAVLSESPVTVDEAAVRGAVASFVGDYDQVPPMYSALKVNGQKLCDLARQGITVERKARTIHIFSIEIMEMALPEVTMRVHCSKGTYIRTLCQDIGEKLGCGACMKALKRTRVSAFTVEEALTLGQISERMQEFRVTNGREPEGKELSFVCQVDLLFPDLPRIGYRPEAQKLVENGNRIPAELLTGMPEEAEEFRFRLYDGEQRFIGIFSKRSDEDTAKPVKLFPDH